MRIATISDWFSLLCGYVFVDYLNLLFGFPHALTGPSDGVGTQSDAHTKARAAALD